jgi:GNAT superfamily N-acetyltransferase
MHAPIERSQRGETDVLFADLPLARRVEAAWDHLGVQNALAQQRRAPEANAEVIAVGGGHAVFLGSGSPLSQAQGLGLTGPVPEEELARMERFFRDHDTPTQIEVASLADPSLLPSLSMRGYLIGEQTHSLVCSLDSLAWREPERHLSRSSSAVEVLPVGTDALEHWVDVVLGCFFQEPEAPPLVLREGAIAMGMVPGVTAWLARVEGQPAGGGSLMIHNRVALICGDGTLPRFRHRGVQTELLRARLSHAKAEGCKLAAICTQPGSGSQHNAERQGFRMVYTRTMLAHR